MVASDLVIVTPIYEDLAASSRLFDELRAVFGAHGVYVLAVDDGSVHQPVAAARLGVAGLAGAVIRLRRNLGHQRAIAVGLSYAIEKLPHAQRIVVMDSDGEDVPRTIADLLRALDTADVDVVVAQRRSRVESLRFRSFYLVYRWMFRLLAGRRINFGNFIAIKRPAARRLVAMPELWIHVASSVLLSRLRVLLCPIDRGPRYAGRSQMNFVNLALHGFRGLMVFAEDVLVRVGIACTLVALAAIVGVIVAVLLKIGGFATPGWFSIALGILVLVFLQTGTLTLVTLMLAGVIRGNMVALVAWEDFVDAVTYATAPPSTPNPTSHAAELV